MFWVCVWRERAVRAAFSASSSDGKTPQLRLARCILTLLFQSDASAHGAPRVMRQWQRAPSAPRATFSLLLASHRCLFIGPSAALMRSRLLIHLCRTSHLFFPTRFRVDLTACDVYIGLFSPSFFSSSFLFSVVSMFSAEVSEELI